MNRVLKDKRAIALFVIPALIVYSVFAVLPILWSVYYSFFDGMPGFSWKFIGLANYANLFKDKNFVKSFVVNIRYVGIVMFGQVGFGLLMALMFKFWLKRFGSTVRTIVFFPVVLPTVAVAMLFAKIYEIQPNYGLLNSFLQGVGLTQYIQPWIGKAATALGSLAAMDIWVALGFYAIILYGALLDIPEDIIEAARIDGCRPVQMFLHVLLPLLTPILVTCLIFSFTGTVKMFESSLALTGGGPGSATKSMSMYMYDMAFTYMKTGFGSVIALFIFAVCVAGSALIRKFDRLKV